jgi:hypothetical protein
VPARGSDSEAGVTTKTAPPILTTVRMIVEDFDAVLEMYAAQLLVQGGIEDARRARFARLWRCATPAGAELELVARDRAVEFLGEGPLSAERMTLLFNAEDVDVSVRAFVDAGATIVESVTTLDDAGSQRAVLRDPGGVLVEVSRLVAPHFGGLVTEDA